MVIAAVYGYANGLFLGLPLLDQQRAVVLLVGTVLAVAGLVAIASRRLARPITRLVQIVSMFVEGSWEQRATLHSNDEIGRLAYLFNQIAEEMGEFQHLLMVRDNEHNDTRRQAPIQLAQVAATSGSLEELLRGSLEIFTKNFACSFAAVYLIERKEPAGVSFAVLAHSTGSLESEAPVLAQRLKTDRINLDTTPTMDWLVGRAIASRRPQVGATQDNTGIFEAALPIIQSVAGNGGRVLGVVDLFATSRVKDSRLGPFSIRVVAEMQSLVGILALGLGNFARTPGATTLTAPGKLSSFLPDLETVFATSRRMAQAETSDQIQEAMCQALRTSPFSSAVLLRPDDAAVDAGSTKIPMRVIECHSSRGHPMVSAASADTIVIPHLDTVERFFTELNQEILLISDVNQAAMGVDRQSEWGANPLLSPELGEPAPPRELVLIARWLGCRTAALFPAMRNGRLLAVMLIGSTADMPPLTTKPELLEPYRDLLGLAATSLERIQTQQNIQRQFIELETFWQVSQAVSFETDIEQLYALIHRQVERAMGQISSFAIVLYDADTNTVRIPYMVEEEQRLQVASFPLGSGFSSEIIRTRRSLLMFTQAEIDARTQELDARQVGEAPKSWLGVPMLFGGQVIGLIIAQDVKEEFRFTAQDERLLSMLATQVAVVVRNARLLEATRRQARQDRLVNEITDRIRRQVDVEAILKTTTTELSRALGAHRATMRIDPQSVIASPANPWPEIAVSDPAPPETIPPDPPAGEAVV
jgi:HAMP domain-containing protein